MAFQRHLFIAALLFDANAESFSFTNLLYRLHVCKHPTPGPLGCGPPICHDGINLPQCHSSSGGSGGSSGSSGSGGSSGSSGSSGSGGSSGSSGGNSKSSGSSGGSGSGGGGRSYYSGGGYYSWNGDIDFSSTAEMCLNGGGCDGMFRQYCDESGYCSYVECEDGDEDCIYTCDTMGRCYQICEEGDEDCGSDFWGYYSSQVSDGNGGVLDAVTDERPWVRASYLGGILLVLLALLAFAVRFAVSKGKESQDAGTKHPLKGSMGRRMKLFDRLAPAKPLPRDPALYRRMGDDGTVGTAVTATDPAPAI